MSYLSMTDIHLSMADIIETSKMLWHDAQIISVQVIRFLGSLARRLVSLTPALCRRLRVFEVSRAPTRWALHELLPGVSWPRLQDIAPAFPATSHSVEWKSAAVGCAL